MKNAQIERQGNRIIAASFSGPIPSPGDLERYERISPGCSKFFFDFAKEEASARHAREIAIVDSCIKESTAEMQLRMRGQLYAFLIIIFCVGLGTVTVLNGHEIIGTMLSAGAVVTMASLFLPERKTPKQPKV